MRTNGKPLFIARSAAIAVLPVSGSPSRSTESSGVRSEVRICSTHRPSVVWISAKLLPYSTIPFVTRASRSSVGAPNLGCTSVRACSKSDHVQQTESASTLMSSVFTARCSAHAAAERTSPASSAPEKFLVRAASSGSSASASSVMRRVFASRMLAVCMLMICSRPLSDGSPISTCTSRRPGLRMASSIMSFRFVMPMIKMLFRESTPSIFARSWFTIESPTPVLSFEEPRDLQMASNSSKMMIWSIELSPSAFCSASASVKRSRMCCSLSPTYLLMTSGPLTTLGSRAFSTCPILRAMRVLPQPGGPYSSIPRTWWMPICSMM
mmetsp:Transcript_17184/g.31187  ORF Transcript_17184/g.31187 Transcript_17184/m.31187 type:complete len:324 (-) Transcript_17184:820-1791(-)